MWAVGIAAVWTIACTSLAWRYPLGMATIGDARFFEELRGHLEQSQDDRERVLVVNDALAEVEHRLAEGSRLPAQAAWLNLAGVALIVVGASIAASSWWLLGAIPIALLGVGGCLLAARQGRRAAGRRRSQLDAGVEEVVGPLYDVDVVLPARSSFRQRRRRTSGRLARH